MEERHPQRNCIMRCRNSWEKKMIQETVLLFKKFRNQLPKYIFSIIRVAMSTYNNRNNDDILLLSIRYNFLKISFFFSAVIE